MWESFSTVSEDNIISPLSDPASVGLAAHFQVKRVSMLVSVNDVAFDSGDEYGNWA